MAVKADFTEAEWQTLEKGVMGTGMLVALADANFFDSFKEVGAFAGHLAEARQKSASLLVRDLAASRGSGFSFGSSPQEVESGTLTALHSALQTLQQKAPDEIPAYRGFVVGVAESVANAVSGVAPSESAAIDKIKGALDEAGSPRAHAVWVGTASVLVEVSRCAIWPGAHGMPSNGCGHRSRPQTRDPPCQHRPERPRHRSRTRSTSR